MSDDVIAALEAALGVTPDNVPLRLHVAGVLLDRGRAVEALAHAGQVLARDPTCLPALQLAARAAKATGEHERAERYTRLASTLQAEAPAPAVAVAVPAGGKPQLRVLEGGDAATPWDVERPTVRMDDVAGLEQVKRRLHLAFFAPLANPDLRRAFAQSLRGGLLLYGPPGCGKTFVARAMAGELGAHFVSIGLDDVLDMWKGQSERNLHDIFESARRHTPCVVFLDELDALGRKRSLMRHGTESNIVSQLLTELDSVASGNEGVFVLGATNHPWDVDPALRRPGRFDRVLLVTPPDEPARLQVLRVHLRDRPVAPDLDLAWVAARTEQFSGADIAHLCNSAVELALEASVDAGAVVPVGGQHFKRALRDVHASIKPWLDTAKNFVLYANEGGAYDDLLAYMRQRRLV
jgi:SpoVK/Ycf46/Vps4 family AAA+-type ATPase